MKKILAITLLIFSSQISSAKPDSLEIQNMMQRVKLLEDYKSNVDNLYKATHQDLITKQTKFENEYNVKHAYWELIIALLLGSGFTLLTLKKWVKDFADKYFDENLKNAFERKSDTVKKLLNEYDNEQIIKREKKVLVVSESKNTLPFKHIKSNFEKVECLVFSDNIRKEIETKDFDLVVFDSIKEIERDDYIIIKDALDNNKRVFVYNVKITDTDLMNKVGSSNFLSQLIGNIMNLIKYN
jgi:ribosomal protein L36